MVTLDVYTSPAKCNHYNTLFLYEILLEYSINNNIKQNNYPHEKYTYLLNIMLYKNTIQIDASPLPVNVASSSFPFGASKQHEYTSLNDQCPVSPK